MSSLPHLTAVAVATLVASLAGCATATDPSTPDAKPTREYRTGSNIPVKDAAPPATKEERDRTEEQIRTMQRASPTGRPGG